MGMAFLDGMLQPTKANEWRWYRASFPAPDALALVRIRQKRREFSQAKEDDEQYWLDFIPDSELQRGFKGFRFVNVNREPTPDRKSEYDVYVREDTLEVLSCTCKGAVCWKQTGAPCKHRDLVAALIERGVFDAADFADIPGILVLF